MPVEREILLKRIEYLDDIISRWLDFIKSIAISYLTPASFSFLLSLPGNIYIAIAVVGIVVALGVIIISFRIARIRREIEKL